MLTKLTICNFKRFGEVEIELGSPVVFIGPNNSGKTSAMQALALWDIGLKRWNEKRSGKKSTPEKRPGVTVNRRDLVAIPIPDANLLWRGLHVRDVRRVNGQQRTSNIRIDITVEGVTNDQSWRCGLEFDYANDESFYCRPLRLSDGKTPDRMPVPDEAGSVQIAFLPPMSGLAATETRLDDGAVNVRIGEGRTAEVLRNLCFRICEGQPSLWKDLVKQIENLFGWKLRPPRYIAERGEIAMTYREQDAELDLSSAGRGLQQTLLLLAYMYANPGSVLLLDEPDAHLEILRQRQIYRLLTDVARASDSQIIAASHSEVLLNEAADRDLVIAFVGQPHRINDRGSQVLKALREIGFEQYYQAEQT
ncbi:MAG: AAA family ATPase, partial [Gemmatimonadota bacterium]|nr:AAA family ATPase [Gemmatimonadota bacterium]